MSVTLGTLEELPRDFQAAMRKVHVSPLWPELHNLLPRDEPQAVTHSGYWSYEQIRPLLLRAGALTPVEKAERRVLVLNGPGHGGSAMQVTSSIYIGLQLLLPGERAPAHRHTASAARLVLEGEGACTIVGGERCPMRRGDLILTPGGYVHDHRHDGEGPVVWLDALDLPLLAYLEGSYSVEGELLQAGSGGGASDADGHRSGHRYPWETMRGALMELGKACGFTQASELEYRDQSGKPCLPTLGFTAMLLPPGVSSQPWRRSVSAVFHVVEGQGRSVSNDSTIHWRAGDTFSAPPFAQLEHVASGPDPAFVIRIDDAPLRGLLGIYEERPRR